MVFALARLCQDCGMMVGKTISRLSRTGGATANLRLLAAKPKLCLQQNGLKGPFCILIFGWKQVINSD
jgi:hypothetical protein